MRVPNVGSFLRNTLTNIPLHLRSFRLNLKNRWSSAPLCHPDGPTLSLTTYGSRLKHVHTVIESIAEGRVLPSRFMLYLDVERDVEQPTRQLRRLKRRGLEIYLAENLGPHTKIQWWVQNGTFDRPHVVADDDILYPTWWLKRIGEEAVNSPDVVLAYRAHRMVLNTEGTALTPYASWPPGVSEPSHLNFATCVSGVLFPPSFLQIMREAGDGFRATTPRNDDLWLTFLGIQHGVPIGLVTGESVHFDVLPGSQGETLNSTNVFEGGNDHQLAQTFQPETYARLLEAEKALGWR